jgi:hypothetical protein
MDVDVEDKEDVRVAAVVTLVEQHRIVIKERRVQTVMNRLKVVEMEIGVPSMDKVLAAERIHLVVDCSGRWYCLLALYMKCRYVLFDLGTICIWIVDQWMCVWID